MGWYFVVWEIQMFKYMEWNLNLYTFLCVLHFLDHNYVGIIIFFRNCVVIITMIRIIMGIIVMIAIIITNGIIIIILFCLFFVFSLLF